MKMRNCVADSILVSVAACLQLFSAANAAAGGAPAVIVAPAPTPPGVKTCTPGKDATCAPVAAVTEPAEGLDPFRGLKWGVGVAFSSSLGGIGDVTVDPTTKVVHVTKLNNSAARGAFDVHYYFKFCNGSGSGGWPIFLPNWRDPSTNLLQCPGYAFPFAMGPFVSLNTSPFDTSSAFASKLFDSVGAGWMIGLNAFDAQPATPTVVHTMNFGIGVILDTSVRQLAPGVMDGQVTAITNQDLLTVKTTKVGWMAILSYRLFEVNLK